MENKVLVKLIIPEIEEEFNIFIPVNELVWRVKKLLVKSVSDIIKTSLDINSEYILINKDNSRVYNNNEIILNTDIRNATELYLIKV